MEAKLSRRDRNVCAVRVGKVGESLSVTTDGDDQRHTRAPNLYIDEALCKNMTSSQLGPCRDTRRQKPMYRHIRIQALTSATHYAYAIGANVCSPFV